MFGIKFNNKLQPLKVAKPKTLSTREIMSGFGKKPKAQKPVVQPKMNDEDKKWWDDFTKS